MACTAAGITKTELGKRIGLSQSAFSQRLKTGKFSDQDFEAMGKALGAKYFSGFIFPDGTEIKQALFIDLNSAFLLYTKHQENVKKHQKILLTLEKPNAIIKTVKGKQ